MLPRSPQKLYFQKLNEGRFMLSIYVGSFDFFVAFNLALTVSFTPQHRRNDLLAPFRAGRLEMKSYTSFIVALYSKPGINSIKLLQV